MHEALAIPELCDLIVGHCCSDPVVLLTLARTCRIFQDQALTLFYGSREIELKVLIKSCLPGVCTKPYEVNFTTYGGLGFTNTTLLSDEDSWTRFNYYSSKVIDLKVDVEDLCPEVFFALSIHSHIRSRFVLFPKLESISIHNPRSFEDANIALHLLPFFVETLRRLVVDCSDCDMLSLLKPLVPALSRLCPNLNSLKVHHKCSLDDQDDEFMLDLFTQVRTWRDVELVVDKLTLATMASIKSLPHLERLSLGFEWLEGMDDLKTIKQNLKAGGSYGGRTRALAHLELQCIPKMMPIIFRFMEYHRMPPESIKLTSEHENYTVNAGDYRDVFLALEEHCASSAVTHLTMNLEELSPDIEFSDIEFLLSFKSMRELKLQGSLLYLENRDMRYIAKAWANLRVLHFGDLHLDEGEGLTLSCLLPLSANCVHLMELAIELDASIVPRIPRKYTGRLLNRAFETLIVGESYIEDPIAVRRFLLNVFPTIKKIVTPETEDTRISYTQDDRACFEMWSKVLS